MALNQLGQLYLVRTSARRRDTQEVVKSVYVLTATSQEDAERVLRYQGDMDGFDRWAITEIARIKPNLHLVSMRIFPSADEPTFVERDGQTVHYSRTNQAPNRNAFAVGIAGVLLGLDGEHALRKLGSYLSRRGLDDNVVSPLVGESAIHVEEMGEGSRETMPRIIEHWNRLHVVSGGAVGSAR